MFLTSLNFLTEVNIFELADSRQIFKPSFLGGKLIPKEAFVKHKLSNQICPTGTKTEGGHLMPELRCNDKFTIEYNWTKQTTMLRLMKTDEIFNDYSLYKVGTYLHIKVFLNGRSQKMAHRVMKWLGTEM